MANFFLIPKFIIDALVATALCGPRDDHSGYVWNSRLATDSDALGKMLIQDNIDAIDYLARYNFDVPPEFSPVALELAEKTYRFPQGVRTLSCVETLATLNWLEFQYREVPAWTSSCSYGFCASLRAAVIQRLSGYEEAATELQEKLAA
jgi:hypothetical protein